MYVFVFINFLHENFDKFLNCLIIENESHHNIYGVTNLEDHERFLTDFEIHFLELPKWAEKSYPGMTRVEKWALFLKAPNEKVLEELAMQDLIFNQAYEKLKYVSQDPVARARYEAELKYELDFNTAVRFAQMKGEIEGEARGMAEGEAKAHRETAKILKASGTPYDVIIKATGLTKEQIDAL